MNIKWNTSYIDIPYNYNTLTTTSSIDDILTHINSLTYKINNLIDNMNHIHEAINSLIEDKIDVTLTTTTTQPQYNPHSIISTDQ